MISIKLNSLNIVNFRNLKDIFINPYHRFNIISGHNGAGKTNLLESIYFLGALRSFRTTFRRELIGPYSDFSTVNGVFEGSVTNLLCDISIGPLGRKIRCAGKIIDSPDRHFGRFPMVLFHPNTLNIVNGSPKERRRFLDRALFQSDPNYPRYLRDYQKLLSSRNLVLKTRPLDLRLISLYDDQLSKVAVEIVTLRRSLINLIEPLFTKTFHTISKGLEGKLLYKANIENDLEVVRRVLRDSLETDVKRGFSSRGPHADDLFIGIGLRKAKGFASQGQQRLLALSLKIAETLTLKKTTGYMPIMLLDDISSELDHERKEILFNSLFQLGGQVFITTTHINHILTKNGYSCFELRDGCLINQIFVSN
jgi:DNA replication and repair protein RecF